MPVAPFTHTQAALLPTLTELMPLEPIFHTPDFGVTPFHFERRMAPDYWEVGASGRRYSREFILDFLAKKPPLDAVSSGWKSFDHALRQLGPAIHLLTYTLLQGDRLSRRSTIWQKTNECWRIVYHQGTIVSSERNNEDASTTGRE